MVAPYPKVDPRRASALQGELAAMARTLVPGWRGTQGEGDAGWALLQIAARLSEHVTRRLDETARRDALAFFSLLDIPPPAARAAEAPVVFALAEKRTTAVIAPERTQLTASARDEELVFETTSAATLTPARLDRVITVDGQADRIEEAPRAVLSLAPPSGAPTTFTAVTFADAGSTTLQLTPSLGLEPEDLLRIGEAAYRVKEAGKNGLIELHEPLENALPAAATVTKITRLESFTLRDRQEHVVFVGHKELLKLDGLAIITLNLEPPGLARALAQLDLAFELWGTGESEKEPGWQELVRLSAAGGKLRLAKAWTGTVDETELGEHKNRFLRLRLRSPITGAAAPVSPLSTLTLGVQSLQPKPEDMPNEGAFGITAAVHNGSPLPLTGAFLPFGPEPQRFDVFAFAAPEMLSKRGATATVTVTLLDGSVAALAIGAGLSEAEGIAVAIGTNGELRTLRFGADRLGTDLLGHPTLAESSVGSAVPDAEPTSLRLAPGPNLATLTVNADGLVRHLVVATDLAGRIWSIALRRLADGSIKRAEPWQLLEDVQPNRPPPRNLLLLPLASPSGSAVAFALVQRDDGMRISRVRKDGAQQGAWRLLRAAAAGQEPELGSATQVVPVRAAQWPALRPEIVVLDEAGTFFHGVIDEPANEVVWAQVGAVGGGSNAVRPAAAVLTDDTDDRLLTQGADPAGRLLTLVDGSIESNPAVLDAFTVVPGTRIELAPHPDPAADRFPIVMAFGTAGDAGASILLYHRPFAPELLETPLVAPLLAKGNGQARSLVGGLIVAEGAPRAVFAGEQETAAQRVVSGRAVTFDLHDALIFDPGTVPGASSAPGFVALDPGPDASIIELGAPVIEAGTMKVYAAASGTLSPDQPYSFFPSLGDAFNGELEEDGGELRLRLDAADSSTVAGTLLLLHRAGEQLSVKVADRTAANGDSFATFESDVTMQAGEVSYLPHLAAADRVVAADDLQTLLEITAGVAEWPETSAALRFGQDIDPATQTLRATSAAGASPWVLVSEAWSSAPADGAAALLVSQAATAWQIDDFTVPFNNPSLSFEYWNGNSWSRLDDDFNDETANLAASGDITFTVPDDIETTEIAGHEDYWVRVRLVGGDYGRAVYQVTSKTNPDKSVTQSITIDTSSLSPPEIRLIVASYELKDPQPAETLLVRNNLDLLDQTQASASPSAAVRLFVGASDLLPKDASRGPRSPVALFLGFSQPFDVDQLSFYVDAIERPDEVELEAQFLGEETWVDLTLEDETHGLNRRGFVRVFGLRAPRRERLFGRELFWLRVFPRGATEWAPELAGLYVNAVPAKHAETIEQEVLGNSRGEPHQRYRLARTPILPDSLELRVRERLPDEERAELLRRRGKEAVATYEARGIKGEWVLWERTDSFIGQSGDARVYIADASGEVRFGDNREGRIPPPGRDVIRAIRYQRGGGQIGNVPAFAIEGVRSPLESVEAVANPVAAGGGVDAPTLDALVATAPARLRHGNRALAAADLEALALAFSTDIRRARCLAPAKPGAPIRLIVLWRTGERCPVPTLVQREALARHLAASAWGALGEEDIEVSAPRYVKIAITVELRARSAELAVGLKIEADRRLAAFLDPLDGGPAGGGWPFGRPVFASDLARLLHELPGLVEITALSITPRDGGGLPPDALICVDPDDDEALDVRVTVGAVEPGESTP